MPKMYPEGYYPTQVWRPIELNPPYTAHGTNYLFTVGLLQPGVPMPAALAELRGIQAQIDKQFPDSKHDIGMQPLSQAVFGNLRSIMNILFAAVAFILLIACVNLANMLLARASDREREFAVRRALGASRMRMLRQSMTESLLLSLSGAAAGLVLAELLIHIPVDAWPRGFHPPSEVHLDLPVMVFTLALGLATGILFGMIPALRTLRSKEALALQPGRSVTESREHRYTRSVLIVSEVALSMLLVAGSLNMAFYFMRLMRVDPGMNPHDVLSMGIMLSPVRYSTPEQMERFSDALLEKLTTLPGVTRGAIAVDMPFTEGGSNGSFSYDGQAAGSADNNPFADFHSVTPGYFATMQTTILQGREFTADDKPGAVKVAVINASMARKLWPGQSAIGKSIHCCSHDGNYVIVGVAADVRFTGPAQNAGFAIYTCIRQNPSPRLAVLLRTAVDPLDLSQAARRAVATLDPAQPVSNIVALESLEQASVAGQLTSTLVTGMLGSLALLLAGIGVYGVMAYSVSRREREFGIRMAMGADRGNILALLFAGALRLIGAGIAFGAALVFGMRAWIESLLGANGTSPSALVGAAVLLCAAAALAILVPARRATSVQPMQALRTE